MPMRLYDTARREVVPFEPGPVVTMYTCGITPYDATHLGHATVYLTYDVLQRRLRDLGHETQCVRNITDVDDPLSPRPASSACTTSTWPPPRRPASTRDMDGARRAARASASRGPRRPSPTSAASSAWCSTGATPTRPAARSTSTSRTFADVRRRSATTTEATMLGLAAERGGNRRRPEQARPARLRALAAVGATTSRRGSRCGVRAARAGTSSARRWPCASSAPPSTCTAAAPT